MSQDVIVLPINPGSDGDGRKWPKHGLDRNDTYYLERIATDKWAHDLPGGRQPSVTYRLDRLPQGYAGFEKAREADRKHVDRYIYGHPNGQFRSLAEFYPHFKHLMDYGGPAGCECKLCTGGSSRKPKSGGTGSGAEGRPARAKPGKTAPTAKRRDQSESDGPRPQKREVVYAEGVPDVYETLIEKLRIAGPGGSVDEPIEERMSPDWRTGNATSKELLQEWRSLPGYAPRMGEIVLFVRKINGGEVIALYDDDEDSAHFQRYDTQEGQWLGHPRWEAGVVTQMPQEPTLDQDLLDDIGKALAVNDSGWRIEPLSQPGSENKPHARQSKYVPLHHIRPFTLWSECVSGLERDKWHPTILHAVTVASSLCVIDKFRFRGTWPHATVFAKGVYIGAELIMVGDTVRLLPRKSEQDEDIVTDVMVVTAIRFRFVNLDLDDTAIITPPPDSPYQTCLHISGRICTLDPTRSFDGVGKVPIGPSELPSSLSGYGQWYHYHDPKRPLLKAEVPYTRVLGRCYEDKAFQAWLGDSKQLATKCLPPNDTPVDISYGLEGITQARKYSQDRDSRIAAQGGGKTWFWADTRIEQLDLHEVNNRTVGVKDAERTKGQMAKWKASLKTLDGKKVGMEEVQAVRKEKEREVAEVEKMQSSYGLVNAAVAPTPEQVEDEILAGGEVGDGEEVDEDDDEEDIEDPQDDMELDEEEDSKPSMGMMGSLRAGSGFQSTKAPIELSDDSEDDETTQLAGKLAMSIRNNGDRKKNDRQSSSGLRFGNQKSPWLH
ncbi:uncharacterized protein LTR77_004254 [Saxophila tyrrhenica]|uniref:Uncharacterized protein n=1 Tax=Saxophila tyrrhenica TaxID=1690608 RepID=A0AAV9PGH8_9PEZI|nr:hypothetical protein LTR77_004254 [Saxophila tyrrhenica]